MDYRDRLTKPSSGIAVFLGIFLIIFAIAAGWLFVNNKNDDVEQAGTKVSCRVVYYEKIMRTYNIRVEYTSADGEPIEAELQMRGFPPSYGERLDGYVLGDPYVVYQEESRLLKIILMVIAGLLGIGGIAVIIASTASSRNYKLLRRSGISGECVIGSVNAKRSGQMTFYYVEYSFRADDGSEQEGKSTYTARPPEYGDRLPVVYAKKGNGKYISELIK